MVGHEVDHEAVDGESEDTTDDHEGVDNESDDTGGDLEAAWVKHVANVIRWSSYGAPSGPSALPPATNIVILKRWRCRMAMPERYSQSSSCMST